MPNTTSKICDDCPHREFVGHDPRNYVRPDCCRPIATGVGPGPLVAPSNTMLTDAGRPEGAPLTRNDRRNTGNRRTR